MGDLWRTVQVLFQQWTGMILPPNMRGRVLDTVHRMAAQAERPPLLYVRALSRDARERQRLLDEIGLGTTWFMRDEAGLQALVDALARVTPTGESVCVWSAGCSSGEEPYSLAMALNEAGLRARILATDLNRRALRVAFDGRYRAHAVERLPPGWRARYFTDAGPGMVRVSDGIRQQVTFELHNFLTSDDLPLGWHRFDAVVCRNVLIYFERTEAIRIIDRLARRCSPGGYLLLGAVERPLFWMRNMAASADAAELVEVRNDRPQRAPVPDAWPDAPPLAMPVPRRASLGEPAPLRERPARERPARERPADDVPRAESGARAGGQEPSVEDLIAQAEAAEQDGRVEEALAMTETAVARAPLSAPAQLARGLALKRAGRIQDAIEAFRGARFLDGHAWLAPFQLAVCLDSVGEAQEAKEAYRHALEVLESRGPTGLGMSSIAVEALGATVAEVCRNRLRKKPGVCS